jgi:biofilm PGA synthesis N-glycosyltransferase PgaC
VVGILFNSLITWLTLLIVYAGASAFYFLYMRKQASRNWNLNVNFEKKRSVSILIPTYNEAKIINLKLENLLKLDYPRNLMQIIVVDSASTDETVKKVQQFVYSHPQLNIEIIKENRRRGKSYALNYALKHVSSDIVVISDADCYWSSNILKEALAYLADPTVGAVAGQEKLLNPVDSWVTRSEAIYRKNMFLVQLGESKLYSTIQFEGGFGAYKRSLLDEFDCETGSDDSGTALNIVQKNVRTIVIPEAIFYTQFPTGWKEKFNMKIRRAQQLLKIWLKCMKLLFRGKLVLPKRIVFIEAFLSFIGPFIFIALILASVTLLVHFPVLVLPLVAAFLLPHIRMYFVEVMQTNLMLLVAIFSLLIGKDVVVWKIARSSRCVEVDILKEKGLI